MTSGQEKDQLLSQLKAQEIDVSRENPSREKQSAAADAAGTFGKYASAMAQERDEDPLKVMRDSHPAEQYNEEGISIKLHEQATHELEAESARNPDHLIPGHSVAAKLQAATDRFDRRTEQ